MTSLEEFRHVFIDSLLKVSYDTGEVIFLLNEILENNTGQKYIVLEEAGRSSAGNKKYLIQFILTGYQTVVEKVQMHRGKIKDRYAPDIHGVGYIGNLNVNDHKREYNIWNKMLERCYNTKNNSFKDYGMKGVKVDKRWHSFENFVHDVPLIDEYDKELFESGALNLDKDLKQEGIKYKVYSKETCTFMTRSKNSSIIDRENRKKSFIAIDPESNELKVEGIGEFAKANGLIKAGIQNCLSGRAKTHKGWKFKHIKE